MKKLLAIVSLLLVTSSAFATFSGNPQRIAAGGTAGANAPQALLNLGALPLAGGTMSGPLNMGSQGITGLVAGASSTDAVNFSQLSALAAVQAQSRYVSTGGSDSNTGSQVTPFLTLQATLASIPDASPIKPYVVYVSPGVYTESNTFALIPNVFIVGVGASALGVTIQRLDGASIVLDISSTAGDASQQYYYGVVFANGMTVNRTGGTLGSGFTSVIFDNASAGDIIYNGSGLRSDFTQLQNFASANSFTGHGCSIQLESGSNIGGDVDLDLSGATAAVPNSRFFSNGAASVGGSLNLDLGADTSGAGSTGAIAQSTQIGGDVNLISGNNLDLLGGSQIQGNLNIAGILLGAANLESSTINGSLSVGPGLTPFVFVDAVSYPEGGVGSYAITLGTPSTAVANSSSVPGGSVTDALNSIYIALMAVPPLDQWASTSIGNDGNSGSINLPKQTIAAAVSQCVAAGANETSICTVHLFSEYYPYCGPLPPGIDIRGIPSIGEFADKPSHVYCDIGGSAAPIQVAFGSVGGDVYLVDIDDLDPSGNASGVNLTSQLSTSQGYSELNLAGTTIKGAVSWAGVGSNNDFLEIFDGSDMRGGGTIDSVGVDYQRSSMRGTWTYADTAGNGGTYFQSIFSNLSDSTQTFTSTTGAMQAIYLSTSSLNTTSTVTGTGASVFYDSNSSKPGTLTVSGGATDSSNQSVSNSSASTNPALTVTQNGNSGSPAAPAVVINDNEAANFPNLELNDTSGNGLASLYLSNSGAGGVTLAQGVSFNQLLSIFDNNANSSPLFIDLSDNLVLQNIGASTAPAVTINQASATNGTGLTVNVSAGSPTGISTPALSVFGPEGVDLGIYDTGTSSGMGMNYGGSSVWFSDSSNGGETVFPNILQVVMQAPISFQNVVNVLPQSLASTPPCVAGPGGTVPTAYTSTGTQCICFPAGAAIWVDTTPVHTACTF